MGEDIERPNMTNAYLFDNGMVIAFDQNGEQMPGYQGSYSEVAAKIKRDFPYVEIRRGAMR